MEVRSEELRSEELRSCARLQARQGGCHCKAMLLLRIPTARVGWWVADWSFAWPVRPTRRQSRPVPKSATTPWAYHPTTSTQPTARPPNCAV